MPSITLVGSRVVLKPMLPQHADALILAASDGDLPSLKVTIVPNPENVAEYMQLAFDHQAQGLAVPFVTTLKETGEIIGSTRFFKIDSVNRNVEIGHTWIAGSWQRSFVNTEAKYLMLSYAFEEMNCLRVQFSTDELNAKSRAAIQRLGAQQEGILRKERIVPGGRIRTTVVFSIIDDEWPQVRATLESRLRAGGVEPALSVIA